VRFPAGRARFYDKATSNGVARGHHDDRDRGCRILRGECRRDRSGQDDVDGLPHEVRRELGKTLEFAFSEPVLDDEGLSMDPTRFPHSLAKSIRKGRVGLRQRGRQSPDSGRFARRLRLSTERRGEEDCRTSQERAAVHHSIT
jgi:hypothetical protein